MNNSWSSSDTVSLIDANVIPGKVVNGSPVTYFPSTCPPKSDLQRYEVKHPTLLTKAVGERLSQAGGADAAPTTYKTNLPFCRAGFSAKDLGPQELAASTAKIYGNADRANAWAETQNAKADPSSGGGKKKRRTYRRRKNLKKKSRKLKKTRKSRKHQKKRKRKTKKHY